MGTYDIMLDGGHCVANCGKGKDWLTIYLVETDPQYRNQGEATRLLTRIKQVCESNNLELRLWCPMNKTIEHICEKIGIEMTGEMPEGMKPIRDIVEGLRSGMISLCKKCWCMTHTIDGKCGKCGADKGEQ